MSTRGRGVVSSGLLGSVTYKIMHESPIPVLAITPERARDRWDSDYGISRVIVPLDGSELSEAALPYAAVIAQRMNMGVTLARVLYLDNVAYSEGYNLGDMLSSAEAEIEAEARRYLTSQARRLREEGLDVQTEILRGSASSEIVALARQTDHNMIALATHGRSGVNRLLMGSVAEAVVRASGDPVLVVRPSAAVTPDPAPSNAPVVAT
jgi:nucleotide-binding universal stress UspA family protein